MKILQFGHKQEQYETSLKAVNQLAKEGEFEKAITELQKTLTQFSRPDGQELLAKLEKVIFAKQLFELGLNHEKSGQLKSAKIKYKAAHTHLPELIDCRIRLGIIAIKENNFSEALTWLEAIEGEQAAYLRGFVKAQQQEWQQAEREWKTIDTFKVKQQRQILKALVEQERVQTLKSIQQGVKSGNLEQASLTSRTFIKKFGLDLLVQQNLNEHILPQIEEITWNSQDWHQIAIFAKQNWLEQQNIRTLHNWAIASYYQAQINSSKLEEFIIAWSTALANLHLNPILKNRPWLNDASIDRDVLSLDLKQILEEFIDAFKDKDIQQYQKLRDIYRREMMALVLFVSSATSGLKVKELLILPGCYQRHCHQLPRRDFPPQLWGALYTNWGLAVAACKDGDVSRAIQIKPTISPTSSVECFAHSFVSYHEGCYHLANKHWRKAVIPLQQAKSQIVGCNEWEKKVERLCEQQRRNIETFDEHLEFAQFWYELLASQPARSYSAEYKAEKIRQQLVANQISEQKALEQLQHLKKIDENNPLVMDLFQSVEIVQETQKIDRLLNNNQFDEAVRVAKRSHHQKIRYILAEIFLNILLKGAENRSLYFGDLQRLGRWAYELCPHEPAFQEIYRSLNIYY